MRRRRTADKRLLSAPGKEAFRPKEWALIQKYRTPRQVQAFLRALSYNWRRRERRCGAFAAWCGTGRPIAWKRR